MMFAEQFTVEPPFVPAQVHVHGPEPATALAVPALQRSVVGAELKLPPWAGPH